MEGEGEFIKITSFKGAKNELLNKQKGRQLLEHSNLYALI